MRLHIYCLSCIALCSHVQVNKDSEYQQKLEANQKAAAERTAKKRAKRLKKKQKAKQQKKSGNAKPESDSGLFALMANIIYNRQYSQIYDYVKLCFMLLL